MSRSLAVLVPLVLALGACGAEPDGAGAGDPATGVPDPEQESPAENLTWGDGAYGVVLAHGYRYPASSWEEEAQAIAAQGATVVAVEDIGVASIEAAVEALQDDGHPDVALVGGSAGADAILQLDAARPRLADQLVLLSPNEVVDGLGKEPKLFVASSDEPSSGVARQLYAASTSKDDALLMLPGSAHAQIIFDTDQGDRVLAAILKRLRQPARTR